MTEVAASLDEARSELEQLKEETRALRLDCAVIAYARQIDAIDPDTVARLLDKTAILFDANGNPLNIREAVDDLIARKPYLRSPDRDAFGRRVVRL